MKSNQIFIVLAVVQSELVVPISALLHQRYTSTLTSYEDTMQRWQQDSLIYPPNSPKFCQFTTIYKLAYLCHTEDWFPTQARGEREQKRRKNERRTCCTF